MARVEGLGLAAGSRRDREMVCSLIRDKPLWPDELPRSLLLPAASISAVMVPSLGNAAQQGTVQHTGRAGLSLALGLAA